MSLHKTIVAKYAGKKNYKVCLYFMINLTKSIPKTVDIVFILALQDQYGKYTLVSS